MGKWIRENGVWCYVEPACTDIKVKDKVKTVKLELPVYSLYNIGRSFPDVEEIVIGKEVTSISMSNFLFPNVKNIISESPKYANGAMLVLKNWNYSVLLNSFCKDEDFIIDMAEITRISEFAFDGCKSTKIINTNAVNLISDKAFNGSAFEKRPFVGGLKMAGQILIGMDETAETIVLPETPVISSSVSDFWSIPAKQTLVIENMESADNIMRKPNKVILKSKKRCNPDKLLRILGDVTGRTIKDIISEVPRYKTVNGIVYSSDMKTLILCPRGKTGDIVIPEGVERIRKRAFEKSFIKSVKLPNSLRTIEAYAFTRCMFLKSIDFGHGIKNIGGNGQKGAFSYCPWLEEVTFPEQIKSIGHETFAGCTNLRSIELNEGLETINTRAFCMTSLKEIKLPKSIKQIQHAVFASHNGIDRVFTESIPLGFISAIMPIDTHAEDYIDVDFNGRHIFIPKSMKPPLLYECKCRFDRSPESLDDKFLNQLYSYSDNPSGYALTAIASYKYSHDTAIKEDLSSPYVVNAMLNKTEKKFVEYIAQDFVSIMPDVLEEVEEKGWPIAAAYVLKKIRQQKGYPNKNTLLI